ncbi:MAG TPA: helix-turn-helix domain-containing protein [Hyphomicrobiaceae bacterium]|nr:helix-turn-helix domain-containing protein [Hyphomicrobiaceae bacterium]
MSRAEAKAADMIAGLIREELARRRMTREQLAFKARISLSTLEKALSGRRPFTLPSVVRLEEALGIALRERQDAEPAAAPMPGTAPDEFGGYARATVGWLEGGYLTLRPSFGSDKAIYAYRTDISWSEERTRLTFRESQRIDADFTQFGDVAVPHQSGHVYLVTNRHGQHRLVMLSRPTITGEMHGLLTTLQAGRGSQLTPVSAPIVLAPLHADGRDALGRITEGHDAYRRYRRLLALTISDGYAIWRPVGG